MMKDNFSLLEVDLTTGKTNVLDVTEEVRNYLGGRGLGAKLLWQRVPQGADPLGAQNILYFGVGPVTGLTSSLVNISFKSPLTLLRGYANMNGHFGAELVNAGYTAGLLITGKASKPVYLYIKDGKVEIRDAAHLWGRLNLETQYALKREIRRELDDQNFAIASIGPAGEHLVRNADICHDLYHHAARLGAGAVMGSKNLKAIAVRGTRPPEYINPDKLFQVITKFFRDGRLFKATERRWGHYWSISQRYYLGREGIKNKQLGWDPICDLSNPVQLEQQYKLWNDSCTLCPAGCKVSHMRREPPLGPCAGEMRHDNAGGWSANVMIPGYDMQLYLTPFIDNLGIDSEDVSGVVAWMMECYQRGLVTKEDLDGIDLRWGDLKAICQLVRAIAYREGIGDILAEGLKFAPQKIGRGTEKYAMTHKGVAITSYELRGSILDAISMAVNPVGELHWDRANPRTLLFDSLTSCLFFVPVIMSVFGGIDKWAVEVLNGACGWELTSEDVNSLALRGAMLERCYCLREGHVPTRDDMIPDRFFDEVIHNKYGEPLKLDRDTFFDSREKWYLNLGLNKEGIPPKECLSRLGLEFVIPVLEKMIGGWT